VLDLNTHLTQIAQMVGRLIGEDIKLRLVLDPKLARAKVDPAQLDQVVINLAVNARDAMGHGGRLRIRTTNVLISNDQAGWTAPPGPYIALVVTDTGCGMTEKTRERIFEPFFTTKPKGKGTGLGLSTVYGIVKQSGGHISVESQPGRGTTFTIYFPQVREELPVNGPQLVTGDGCRGSETILVVEDEMVVERFICEALRSYGYTVLSARRGDEALALARTHRGPINLLLTDVVMPGMNGVETARQLKVLRHDIKVILMSGYADTPIIRNGALTEGRFLQKPILAPVLARAIRDELDGVGVVTK
jgi:CheY-like chemotaxis protein